MSKKCDLKRYRHTRRWLQRRMLEYFDHTSERWDREQQRAAVSFLHMVRRLGNPAHAPTIPTPARISKLESLMGKIFFMDGLKGVDMVQHTNADSWDGPPEAVASTHHCRKRIKSTIFFNLSHPVWQWLNPDERCIFFLGTLAHEFVHLLFGRFAKTNGLQILQISTGHHEEWQFVAGAVERRMQRWFGTDINLSRESSFILECESRGRVEMNVDELRACFNERFWYSEATVMLCNMGEELDFISEEQGEKYEHHRPAAISVDVFR